MLQLVEKVAFADSKDSIDGNFKETIRSVS